MGKRGYYSFEKRQRERKRQRKREEKAERRRLRKEAAAGGEDAGEDTEVEVDGAQGPGESTEDSERSGAGDDARQKLR